MKSFPTAFGMAHVMKTEALMPEILHQMHLVAQSGATKPVVALMGGSTPKAFFRWASEHVYSAHASWLNQITWTVSDERCLPLEDPESNWGVARRNWLNQLDLSEAQRLPWPVTLPPESAATRYSHAWQLLYGPNRTYDLCLLGMGDDCHTASLWPNCPLISEDESESFAATFWPGKGWRLTITPSGLTRCARIVVVVSGASKAQAVSDVLKGSFSPQTKPAQVLRAAAHRTTWLLDSAAAALL